MRRRANQQKRKKLDRQLLCKYLTTRAGAQFLLCVQYRPTERLAAFSETMHNAVGLLEEAELLYCGSIGGFAPHQRHPDTYTGKLLYSDEYVNVFARWYWLYSNVLDLNEQRAFIKARVHANGNFAAACVFWKAQR